MAQWKAELFARRPKTAKLWADGPAVYEATFIAIQFARGRKMSEKKREANRRRATKFDRALAQEAARGR